jgi:hypothetical protein
LIVLIANTHLRDLEEIVASSAIPKELSPKSHPVRDLI